MIRLLRYPKIKEMIIMKLLLVEDEKRMGQAIVEFLKQENYSVDWYLDGKEGLEAIKEGIYDIAVIDVMLPHINGFDITFEARKNGIRTPILILTALNDTDNKVNGLDCGADDYLTKPFASKELLARLRAMTRRIYNTEDGKLYFEDISLNTKTMELANKNTGESIRLSDKEYKIIELLVANSDRIITREQIALKIWGYENESEYNNVEVYMTFVRKKLKFINSAAKIKAVRGIGYELRN